MRLGYAAQRSDYIVTTRAATFSHRLGCKCEAVQPEDFSGVKYNGLGVMML